METNTDQIFEIFHEAKKIPAGSARQQFLSGSCAGDLELRDQVATLLRAEESSGEFLSPAALVPAMILTESPGDWVGRYKLVEKIGEGGCGVVYLAEQEKPVRRRVALKIIKLGMDTKQVVARFEAERQALALMDHPNIARVYDAGATDTGRPYFVMELVSGKKITEFCDAQKLSIEARLKLFLEVCEAIQHAHQKGIIHRDIKPSNVLVAQQDARPVPKVIDFGIAKATEGNLTDLTITECNQFIGTPAYMSPEQAEWSARDIDTRSDVYSLGVLLYELLTGRTPIEAGALNALGLDEMRRIVRSAEPPKPSDRLSALPKEDFARVAEARRSEPAKLLEAARGDLDCVVMTCLEKDRSRRYQSASGLAADIERHLSDEPVVARPPSAGYRLRKSWRRNRVAFSAGLAIAAALVLAVAALSVSTFRISLANQKTGEALRAETDAKASLEVNSYFQSAALAHRELSADNLGGALKFLAECPPGLRGWEWRYLDRLARAEPVILQEATRVHGVAFHPDGKMIAAGYSDGTVKIWDLASKRVIQILRCPAKYVFCVAFRPPHGRHLAAADSDRKVRVWDWKSGTQQFEFDGPRPEFRGLSNSLAYNKDGTQLFADGGKATLVARDASDGREISSPHPKEEAIVTSVEASGGGGLIATGTWGGVLSIYNPRTGGVARPRGEDSHTHRISGVCFAPGGAWVATGSFDRMIKIWDPLTCKLLRSWEGSGGLISALALSPDGRRLASCGVEDKTVRLWDPLTGREILNLRGHTAMAHGVAFSPDGQRLASSSHDGTIRIWDATPLDPGERMESHTCQHGSEVWSLAFSPRGDALASGSWDNAARIWDPKTGALQRTLKHGGSVFHVAYSAGGQLVSAALSSSRSAAVTGWDPETGGELFSFSEEAFPFCAKFDPTGEFVLRETKEYRIKVLNARTREVAGTFGHHDFNVWGMAFSPDGRHLVTGSSDGFIRLWPWRPDQLGQTQEPLWKAPGRSLGYGERVAFSPNGETILAGGDGNTVRILNSKTGAVIGELAGHTGEVWAIAVDRQGRWIATAGEDTTIRIWDSKSSKPLRTLRGHTGFVMSLAFSPAGDQLASGSRDATVKFWDSAGWTESTTAR